MRTRTISYLLLITVAFSFSSCGYNSLVDKQEAVRGQWANVETAYQRRAELIPNLVATVKGAGDYEKETLREVTEARSKATSIQIDPSNITPDQLKKFQAAQQQFTGAISRLLATFERYPDLKAVQNYTTLMAQIEGSENRIAVERRKYNLAAQEYNAATKRFPTVIYSKSLGFEAFGYFESDEGSSKAPKVEF